MTMSTLTQDELHDIRERTWAAFSASPEFVPQACADALKLLAHIDALTNELATLRALYQRVDEVEIALLSSGDTAPIPVAMVHNSFAYIWHGARLTAPETPGSATIPLDESEASA